MYTPFGKFVRKLRIDKDEVLKDMATKLGVSAAFLSSLETGKKTIPDSIYSKLVEAYCLSNESQKDLKLAIEQSTSSVKVCLSGCNPIKNETALLFARTFDEVDDAIAQKIRKLLLGED